MSENLRGDFLTHTVVTSHSYYVDDDYPATAGIQ